MAASDGYGQRLGEQLGVEKAPRSLLSTAQSRDSRHRIRCDDPLPGMTSPVQREDAFLVGLVLRDFPHRVYWEEGRQTPMCDLRAGDTCVHDLKRDPVVLLDKPHHSLFFYLPRAVLNAIADDASAPRIGDLDCRRPRPSTTPRSPAWWHDTSGIEPFPASQPVVCRPRFAGDRRPCASTYGGMRPVARPVRGGLAPWQERRAKEILCANLDGGVPLKEVARECRLSVSHFSRAFRRTIGVAPHHWLLTRRIEAAKEKMRDRRLSLSDVALACGFADQSHLTRALTGKVGVSPGAWRRALDGHQAEELQRSRSNAA